MATTNASTSLVALDLSSNYFDRILHAIVSLLSLSYLDLSHNILQCKFPDSMGNLIRLSFFNLSYNQLQGEFPDTLGNLSCLSCHVLSNNELQGEFPRSSNQLNKSLMQGNLRLHNLKLLDMFENKFTGEVPNLSSCLSLRWLSLHGNMFNGTLTESIGYLPNVEHLDLTHLLNLSKLRALDLSFNSNLTIKVSPSWNPPFQLSSLTLTHCILGLRFLKWLQNQKELEHPTLVWDNNQMTSQLNMSHNQIHGVFPDLSSKIHLSTLDLSSSEFSGSPPLLPQGITDVYLSINKFSGTIANFYTNFRNFRNFYALDLSDNLFAIEISQDCFTHLMILTYLNLANNNFSGEIQNSVDFCRPSLLHLRNNSFTGKFSRLLKNYSSLIILDLGENKFIGTRESMLDLGVLSLKSNKLYAKLQVLDISGNKISRTIPKCVKNLTVLSSKPNYESWDSRCIPHDISRLELLNFLDLSKNNLSSSIPPTLLQMSHLGMLDLSFNNFSGRIPWDTHMQTFDASTYMGNPELCGPPLVFKSHLEDEMPKKPPKGFYISMALGFIVAFWGVSGTLLLNKWCWNNVLKMCINIEDWFYVNILY
ncbi:Leucine-rich repeat protein [Handroanthus impetiginosus]|uniref:Leucine-rich repeat protein n=1 Tax=Handroanthus impetiginosus TaxID=429701 RepID=A0A2G9GT64_9LAMI|nr:Leucine-rich repeat protein [Handroanthus impetiginosus]